MGLNEEVRGLWILLDERRSGNGCLTDGVSESRWIGSSGSFCVSSVSSNSVDALCFNPLKPQVFHDSFQRSLFICNASIFTFSRVGRIDLRGVIVKDSDYP